MGRLWDMVQGFPFLVFFLGYLAATLLIFIHLKKRRHWWIALIVLIALYVAFGLIVVKTGISLNFSNSIIPISLVFFLAMATFLLCSCKATVTEALFGSMCAYASEHLANAIFMILRQFARKIFDISLNEYPTHFVLYFVVFLFLEFAVFRNLQQNGKLRLKTLTTLFSGLLVFTIVSLLYYQIIEAFITDRGTWLVFVYAMVYDLLCCALFLVLQVIEQRSARFKEDLEVERLLRQRQKEQYMMTKDSVSLIERKCHDLKHQIAALRSIDSREVREKSIQEIEEAILIYGAVVKTGSDVLDTVLMDKYLYCEQHDISWTCMADGSNLNFMDPVDLYVLFANALDNAIEAVQQLDDPKQRAISVSVYTKYHMVFLQIENYYKDALKFDNELPKTTKPEKELHGFGLKSVQYTAEKYGGSMQIETENQIFSLYIAIPLP